MAWLDFLMSKNDDIPVIGVTATNAKLSDILRYPYYVRTIPSDAYQAVT